MRVYRNGGAAYSDILIVGSVSGSGYEYIEDLFVT